MLKKFMTNLLNSSGAHSEDKHISFKSHLCRSVSLAVLGGVLSFSAALADETKFNIKSQSLRDALLEFSAQADMVVVVPEDIGPSEAARALYGVMDADEGLKLLLKDTGLYYTRGKRGQFNISKDPSYDFQAVSFTTEADYEENFTVSEDDERADEVEGFALEEIVVTASRRATNLQDTAMSLNVLTGEHLEERGVLALSDIISTVPGVSLTISEPGRTGVLIRGISTSSFATSGRATTSTYLDDFPLGGGTQFRTPDIRLVDVSRVEVIKGPQGTLYGQSAMGGVIRYITNQPNMEELSGGISSRLSHTDRGDINWGVQGHINVPLSDTVAIRVVAYDYNDDGFIDSHSGLGNNLNTANTTGVRAALKWDVNDNITFDSLYLNQRLTKGKEQNITSAFTPTPYPGVPTDVTLPNLSELTTQFGAAPWVIDYEMVNFKLDVDLGEFSVTAMGAKKWLDSDVTLEIVEQLSIFEGSIPFFQVDKTEAETFELRAVSDRAEGELLDWIAGFYYESTDNQVHLGASYIGPDILWLGFLPLSQSDSNLSNARTFSKSNEKAFYGELGFNFTDKLRLSAGYRWSNIEIENGTLVADGTFQIVTGQAALVGRENDLIADQKVSTYRVNLEYRPIDDVMVYAQAASGYRPGGANAPSFLDPDGSTYVSDTLWNYEVGARTTWLDGRLTANLTLFRIDWSGIQLTGVDPKSFAPGTFNVGKARINGLELESQYRINENLSVGFNAGYTDPILTEDYSIGSTLVAEAGDRLPGSTKWTYAVFADFQYPVSADLDLAIHATHRYVGDREQILGASVFIQDAPHPSYNITDVRMSLSHANGIEVSLFADNLFNNIARTAARRTGGVFDTFWITRPRTIGINVGYNF
ncbi:TonB-dependent receptor [Paremcibacter congregatus]|nr:TonB-dependent receptor [Paremcibacter congregatus]